MIMSISASRIGNSDPDSYVSLKLSIAIMRLFLYAPKDKVDGSGAAAVCRILRSSLDISMTDTLRFIRGKISEFCEEKDLTNEKTYLLVRKASCPLRLGLQSIYEQPSRDIIGCVVVLQAESRKAAQFTG